MLFAVAIWGPGRVLIFVAILIGVGTHVSKKYLADNPDVKDVAKKATARKIIDLITKWLK